MNQIVLHLELKEGKVVFYQKCVRYSGTYLISFNQEVTTHDN
jgi:hypothetical protein